MNSPNIKYKTKCNEKTFKNEPRRETNLRSNVIDFNKGGVINKTFTLAHVMR